MQILLTIKLDCLIRLLCCLPIYNMRSLIVCSVLFHCLAFYWSLGFCMHVLKMLVNLWKWTAWDIETTWSSAPQLQFRMSCNVRIQLVTHAMRIKLQREINDEKESISESLSRLILQEFSWKGLGNICFHQISAF